tara:strand:- start:692 stop:2386 length:1695 start_codon:yes stop_codon:yes gene_type:complete
MFFLIFFLSLLIFFSTIGYGFIFLKLFRLENFDYNFGIVGIIGLFFLSIISSYSHLFFPHNYIHNIIIIIIGLFSFIFNQTITSKEIKSQTILFVMLFIALLIAKTNEDFGYYHLPNSIQFAEQKLQFGLGNLNHGFKHISSLFMLMSLYYLPFVEHYLFNLTNFLFLVFFVAFVLKEIFLQKKNNLNFSNIILSFFLILILSKFSRLAEYGSDLAGQIIIFIFIFFLIELFFNQKIQNIKLNYLKISSILIIFAITLKFISVIYAILFLPLFLMRKKNNLILSLLKIKNLLFIIPPIFIFIFLNFSATGCLIYPVEVLCFTESFDWSLSSDTIRYLNTHYEIWSKGGMGPGFSINNKEQYLENFNWISHWTKIYFFGKFTDYILVIFIITIIFASFFYKELKNNKIKKLQLNKNLFLFYFLFLIIFLMWFLNFPTLRYSGYAIVFLLIVFPVSLYLNGKIDLSNKNTLKKISIIFFISYTIFVYKNISRIYNEFQLSKIEHNNFKEFPFYWTDKKKFKKILVDNHYLYLTQGKCWATPSTCVRSVDSLKIIKKNSYIFYILKK